MTKPNQARDLMATLWEALHTRACNLGRTRDGVDESARQAARLRAGVAALGALWQREDTSVGIEMCTAASLLAVPNII